MIQWVPRLDRRQKSQYLSLAATRGSGMVHAPTMAEDDSEQEVPTAELEAKRAELYAREPEEVDERIAAAYGRLGRALGAGIVLSAFVPSLVKPDKDVNLLGSILFFVPVGIVVAILGTVMQRRGARQAEARRAWERELRKLESASSRLLKDS